MAVHGWCKQKTQAECLEAATPLYGLLALSPNVSFKMQPANKVPTLGGDVITNLNATTDPGDHRRS